MITHFVKVALRALVRHKIYSSLNIIGLALGMACSILILLYVRFELSYDRYHEKADRLYRLATRVEGASYDGIAKLTGPWGLAAKQELPEVEDMTRFVFFGQTLMERGETRLYETGGLYADPAVFSMFSFPFLKGEKTTALVRPNTIVMTRELAERYFGEGDPLGQTIVLNGQTPYTVTGVLDEVPPNSHFSFTFLASMSSLAHPDRDHWIRWNQFYTYLMLKEGTSREVVEAKIPAILQKNMGEQGARYRPFLQPMTEIHLTSNLFREMAPNSNVMYLYVMSAIGLFLLLIGCVNFMNLSTARAAKRGKEVGMRKVTGANRASLAGQFMGESLLMSILALFGAIALVELILPTFNNLVGREISVAWFSDLPLFGALIGITVFVGIVAGSYPAIILSSFQPTEVLKGQWRGSKGALLRKALVVFQFAISAFFLAGSGIVYDQLEFIQTRQLGFNQEQLVVIPIREPSLAFRSSAIKEELLRNPSITGVSITANMPGGNDFGIPCVPEGVPPDQIPPIRIFAVDHDLLPTFQMTMASGRGFSKEIASDTSAAFLINEEAARQLGWENPIGKNIAMRAIGRAAAPVIGVVKDFHFRSLREQIAPLVFFIPPPNWFTTFVVRVNPARTSEALQYLEEKFAAFDPAHPFAYTFFDERFGRLYQAERSIGEMITFFTILAVVIASLGLFGLSAFSAEQRTKEIGVRKVLGSSVTGIVGLLSKDFLKLVLLANVLAWPLVYWAAGWWLESFAYQTELRVWTFVGAGLIGLFIAFVTVSFQCVKAAWANPVEALRYE